MRGYRKILLMIGLATLLGVLANNVQGQSTLMTLTVYAGAGTSGPVLYTTTGSSSDVEANTAVLNPALAAGGYGQYFFTSLEGTGNLSGGPRGGYVLTSGTVNITLLGNSGIGTPITIALENSYFINPFGPNSSLVTSATANYASTVTGSTQSDYSTFTDSTPTTITGATLTQPSNGTPFDTHSGSLSQPLSAYVTPYTLENVLTLSLIPGAGETFASDAFSGQSLVTTSVPEPSVAAIGLVALALLARSRRPRRATR